MCHDWRFSSGNRIWGEVCHRCLGTARRFQRSRGNDLYLASRRRNGCGKRFLSGVIFPEKSIPMSTPIIYAIHYWNSKRNARSADYQRTSAEICDMQPFNCPR
ncbi:PREDICTED: uncharacterized protein LOC105568968 [Vollenhovia emeryi]|uniref:uncharacterized protein LOC105568968 n=1 Tax=Vollenhovia emeryi TaxID=411798 RepID=UPI0005F55B26|nr:PREDICTED: uncharacterized protein LOC105568968 [Vollenhovia emeryi]